MSIPELYITRIQSALPASTRPSAGIRIPHSQGYGRWTSRRVCWRVVANDCISDMLFQIRKAR